MNASILTETIFFILKFFSNSWEKWKDLNTYDFMIPVQKNGDVSSMPPTKRFGTTINLHLSGPLKAGIRERIGKDGLNQSAVARKMIEAGLKATEKG
jgi:hypothetical protein